ncbi:MAG: Plug domain-containing protein [Parvularculaceae bacterium]
MRIWIAGLAGSLMGSGALAQDEPIDEIIVRADPLELIELDASRAVMGLDLSYAEAPRSVNVVSDALIERFSIETVDDLAAFAPGTFTGSFFGVPGSMSLRGNRADTYFRGFKRVENPGTFRHRSARASASRSSRTDARHLWRGPRRRLPEHHAADRQDRARNRR